MILLRTIASNPDLAFLASVIIVAVVSVIRVAIGFGEELNRWGDE